MIELVDVSVSFGAVKPLDELSLRIDAPTHGIIGPNGAGKTTLLNALSGFVGNVDGKVTAFGDDIMTLSARARARWGLRRTFQTMQLAEDMSALDNVIVSVDHCPHEFGHKRQAAEAACELVRLGDTHRMANDLSTYERRLTEIARALAGHPKVVLLDEPAAGVSIAERTLLTDLLCGLVEKTGTWLILIDHDVDLISTVCQTTTALDFGAHVATGPTEEVLSDPKVVEAYLGSATAVGA